MNLNSLNPANSIQHGLLFIFKFIISLIGILLLVTGLVFLSGHGIPETGSIFPVALVLTIFLTVWEFRKFYHVPASRIFLYLLISLSIFLVATLASGWIYDKSWDGMGYHQIGIFELSNGWNPFFEQLPYEAKTSKYFDRPINLNLWVNHYSKALETFSAVLMSVTGNIESGKVFNILMLLSAFCSTLYLFVKLNLFSSFWNVIIAFTAAFNPIAVNQLFSYYLDGAIASAILILITQLVLLFLKSDNDAGWPGYVSIFFIVIILINLKFTGLLYLACICSVFLSLVLYAKRWQFLKVLLKTMSISVLLAIFVAGFNPYVTNTLHHGHPFYPIAGKNKVDVIQHMMPAPLKDHNRVGKFFISTYARCDNFSKGSDRGLQYKVPFTFSIQEAKVLQSEGIRLGGFGVLWSGIFTVTIIFTFLIITQLQGRVRIYFFICLIAIAFSVVINPAAWWARFVPQLWLFPVMVSVFLLATQKKAMFQVLGKTLVILMIVNSAVVGVIYSYSVYTTTTSANRIFEQLKKTTRPVYVYFDIFTPNIRKLQSNNILFTKVDRFEDLHCDTPGTVLKINFCQSSGAETVQVQKK